ncbi:hypothetical protein BT69DRAFT_1351890 [Atractiella rhizophila]|nr:hypothetical protein BT69DRAFT_1351890 [Atractiella rhizophila]
MQKNTSPSLLRKASDTSFSSSVSHVSTASSLPGPGRSLRRPSAINLRSSNMGTPRSSTPSGSPPPPLPEASALSPRDPNAAPVVGDRVRVENMGVSGTLRYLGEIKGKKGIWAGVELEGSDRGKGKNDGSVAGVAYFTCEPQCGIFTAPDKISLIPAPTPSSVISLSAAHTTPKATSKLAKHLPAHPVSPSKSTRVRSETLSSTTSGPTPSAAARKSRPSSPEKLSYSMASTPSLGGGGAARKSRPSSPEKLASSFAKPPPSPSKPLNSSTASTASAASTTTTPRAKRMSGIGVPYLSNGGRKSLGPGGTARLSLGTSHSVLDRDRGPLSASIPITPVLPSPAPLSRPPSSAGLARKRSESQLGHKRSESQLGHKRSESGLGHSRSSSRASIAAEANLRDLKADFEEESEGMKAQMEGLKRDVSRLKSLLGERERELVEVRLVRDDEVDARMEALKKKEEAEMEWRRKEEEWKKRLESEEGSVKASMGRIKDLENKLKELGESVSREKDKEGESLSSFKALLAARDSEIDTMRKETKELERKMLEQSDAAAEDRKDLEAQFEELREAGQALCSVYEERIASSEQLRAEAEQEAESALQNLEKYKAEVEARSDPAQLAAIQTSAAVIDNETLKAEVEHLSTKVGSLEEQLAEARGHLEKEMADTKRRRQKSNDVESTLRRELKTLKEQVERATGAEEKAIQRSGELEEAFLESQIALENERAEVERLREMSSGGGGMDLDKELKRMQKALEVEREEKKRLKKELDSVLASGSGTGGDEETSSNKLRIELQARDDEIKLLRQRLSEAGRQSGGSRRSVGGEGDMEEQVSGYKILVKNLSDENKKLMEEKMSLEVQMDTLKDAHIALEATVVNLTKELGENGRTLIPPTSPALGRDEEIASLKAKMEEMAKKSAREVKALNQEVSELEALVESKVFREEELDAEVRKLRKMVGQGGPQAPSNASIHSSTPPSSQRHLSNGHISPDGSEPCEMCGRGHSLEDCPIFLGLDEEEEGAAPTDKKDRKLYCSNCESFDHDTDNCPHDNDVF